MSVEKSSIGHNADHEEITKSGAVASHWRDLKGEFRPLHRINPLCLDYIAERAGGLFDKKVLDVGCGGGILAESMVQEGATVTGLGAGFKSSQVTKLYALENGIQVDYVQETVEKHTVKRTGQYDVVIRMGMLEYVSDSQSVVRACAQLVKPGSDVFLSTLNRNGKLWLMAVAGAEYILRIVPKGTRDVKKFIKPAELLGWMDQTSPKERHMAGLYYSPIINIFKLGPGVDANYMLHTQNKWGCCLDSFGNRAKLDATLAASYQAYKRSPQTR